MAMMSVTPIATSDHINVAVLAVMLATTLTTVRVKSSATWDVLRVVLRLALPFELRVAACVMVLAMSAVVEWFMVVGFLVTTHPAEPHDSKCTCG